jgi:hypothetical protein
MHARHPAALAGLGVWSLASFAYAQAEPVRLKYRAPSQCSSESEFFQEVTTRTARARRATPTEHARGFEVTIALEADITYGRLAITNVDGTLSTREVTGETCAEVVSALALMTALSIDPMAIVTPGSGPQAQEPSTDGAPTPGVNPSKPSETARPAGKPAPDIPSERRQASTPKPVTPDGAIDAHSGAVASESTPHPRWAMGGGGEALVGLAPVWGLGGGVFVAVEGKARGHFVPAFRASFSTAAASAEFPQATGAGLVWLLAGFEACPLRFAWSTELSTSFCGELQGGVLHSGGASAGLQRNYDAYMPWVAAGALSRVAWAVSDHWFVEGAAGLTVPLIRYHFYFQDAYNQSVTVYEFKPVGATLGMLTGYRFP